MIRQALPPCTTLSGGGGDCSGGGGGGGEGGGSGVGGGGGRNSATASTPVMLAMSVRPASRQGLTLVHISAQPEHFLRIFVTETRGLISQKVLKSI